MGDLRNRVCLFVSSSDRTVDVFGNVSQSFAVWWPECPFIRFVGLNAAPAAGSFNPVRAPVRGWQKELLLQIEQLPPQYDYVLLFLDDFFLLSRVSQERLLSLLRQAMERDIDYLRLVPQQRVLVSRVWDGLRRDAASIEPINPAMPYYSSLQVAFWKRKHLVETLRLPVRSIWEFEHHQTPGSVHFAIRGAAAIRYVHVVEKGKWQAYASALFQKAELPFHAGTRPSQPRVSLVWIAISRLRFAVIGYSLMRLRRHMHGAQ